MSPAISLTWRRPVEHREVRQADQTGDWFHSEAVVKFAQLPIGAVFLFGDRRYRKVSPLEAVEDTTGARRLIHRSASIELVERQHAEAAPPSGIKLPLEAVEYALHGCIRKVEQRTKRLLPTLSDDQLVAVLTLMREAHADAIDRLRLGTDRERHANETTDSNHSLGSDPSTKGVENP